MCEWFELQWERGESVNFIADTLSGLHHFWPQIRGHLKEAWRLFPARAESGCSYKSSSAHGPAGACYCMPSRAERSTDLRLLDCRRFSCIIADWGNLALRYCDFEFNSICGIINLGSSKSGLRTGSQESVALRDPTTLALLDSLWMLHVNFFVTYFKLTCVSFKFVIFNISPTLYEEEEQPFCCNRGYL